MQTIMKRRGFSLLAFFMAVVLVLTACGGGKSDNRNAGNADSGANAGNSGGNSDAGAPTGSYLQQAYDGAFKGKVVTM